MKLAMKRLKLSQIFLHLRLLINRLGWVNSLTLSLLFMGLGAGGWQLYQLQRQTDAAAKALSLANQSIRTDYRPPQEPRMALTAQRLQQFHDTLGEQDYVEQQVKTLFSLARKNGLTLNQAEYQPAHDKQGHFYTYQISLPVRGPYRAIRLFCEQTLLAIPFAALNDISFKRDSADSQTPEAKLRFTLYLAESTSRPAPEAIQ